MVSLPLYNGSTFPFHQQSAALTHLHLRKAKLVYKRRVDLCLELLFCREFFYMQMEKYAKQAIAEGIRDKNDIVVTIESEIYKQLNQHYNRNSVIEPPERLVFVVQETLREFFVALQANKDAEPSWKNAIYQVVQQLDEQIPDYFNDPSFMETLARQ